MGIGKALWLSGTKGGEPAFPGGQEAAVVAGIHVDDRIPLIGHYGRDRKDLSPLALDTGGAVTCGELW